MLSSLQKSPEFQNFMEERKEIKNGFRIPLLERLYDSLFDENKKPPYRKIGRFTRDEDRKQKLEEKYNM